MSTERKEEKVNNPPEEPKQQEKRKEAGGESREKGTEENVEENSYQERKKKKDLSEMEEWLQSKENSMWTEFPDYKERAKEINQRIEKEKRERENRISRARKEEKSWELIRLCTEFFDEHCETWRENEQERKKLEEKERKREERKRKAEQKKITFKLGQTQKKISNYMRKLPEKERKKFESEEERKRRQRLRQIKEIMWKRTRSEGEKIEDENRQPSSLEDLEGKLEEIENLVQRVEKEKKEMEEKKRKILEGIESKKRKSKLDRLEIKRKLEEKWAIVRWALEFRDMNQSQWDSDRDVRQNEKEGTVSRPVLEDLISAPGPVRGEEGGGDSDQSPPLNEKLLNIGKINENNENGKAEKIGNELSLANLEKEETVSRPVLEDFISASGPVRGEEGGGDSVQSPPLNEKILKVDKINENGKAEKIGDELSLANLEKPTPPSKKIPDSDKKTRTEIDELRSEITKAALSLANLEMLPRAWSAMRKILRFEQKLESAVMRMAHLGCIDEVEEPLKYQTDDQVESEGDKTDEFEEDLLDRLSDNNNQPSVAQLSVECEQVRSVMDVGQMTDVVTNDANLKQKQVGHDDTKPDECELRVARTSPYDVDARLDDHRDDTDADRCTNSIDNILSDSDLRINVKVTARCDRNGGPIELTKEGSTNVIPSSNVTGQSVAGQSVANSRNNAKNEVVTSVNNLRTDNEYKMGQIDEHWMGEQDPIVAQHSPESTEKKNVNVDVCDTRMMIPGDIVCAKAPIVTLCNKVRIESLNREVILGEIEIERFSVKLRENSYF